MKPTTEPSLSFFNRRDMLTLLGFVAPLIFILFVSVYFSDFVINAVAANLAINTLIICSSACGVTLIVLRMISAQKDFRVIERFGYEAGQGVYMKTLLDQPWLKGRYVRHYLSHIANTGGTLSTQLEQSAIENELHALQTDYDSRLELPQFLVGFMIAMGLLGTFIGLLSTLTGISGMLDNINGNGSDQQQQFMKLVSELRKPLSGMGIAFSASMFGLVTSLMLAIMMTSLRRYVSRVISLARNVMHDLTEMAREKDSYGSAQSLSPIDIDALLRSENAASSDMSGVGQQGGGYGGGGGGGGGLAVSATMSAQFDVLTKKIELLLDAFTSSGDMTRSLVNILPQMKEVSEKSLLEIQEVATSSKGQHMLMESMAATNGEIARSVSNLFEFQKQAMAGQQQIVRTLIDSNSGIVHATNMLLENQRQAHSEQQKNSQIIVAANSDSARTLLSLLETYRHIQDESQNDAKSLVSASNDATRAISGLVESQHHTRNELSQVARKATEQLVEMRQLETNSSTHLNDIKESFTKFCQNTPMFDMIAAGVGGQNMLLETLVEEIRRSQASLDQMYKAMVNTANSKSSP